jgi:hypothetical protein
VDKLWIVFVNAKKSSIFDAVSVLSFCRKDCSVAAVAVEVLCRRESELFGAEHKIGIVLPEVFDKAAVFIFLDTAGAVADYSMGIEHRCSGI